MGITAFFYAAEGDIDAVEAAMRAVWPDEVGALRREDRAGGAAVEHVYAAPDGARLALWQDGKYTGFAESDLVLFDDGALAELSARTGTVIAVCIGDHGGQYVLQVYRNGRCVRGLDNLAGPTGEPLPEEEGLDLTSFRDSHIDRIWSAFGLSPYFDGVPPFRVYLSPPAAVAPEPAAPAPAEKKPWWKLW